jgi:uncharacterized protein with von Willebrand factor type A (vWA) domain
VEQQLKRAEALQRRRMQVEKANRESEVYPVTFTCTYIFFSLMEIAKMLERIED